MTIPDVSVPPQKESVNISRTYGGKESSVGLFVHAEKDSNARTSFFNKDINDLGIQGQIKSCSLLITIVEGQNPSYGAFCSLETNDKKRNIYICNDEMVGHVAIYHASVISESGSALIRFVVNNCIGG